MKKASNLRKRAKAKINGLEVGKGSAGMRADYHLEHNSVIRNDPKAKMSKKERQRLRWEVWSEISKETSCDRCVAVGRISR
jgi:hypothetical protein